MAAGESGTVSETGLRMRPAYGTSSSAKRELSYEGSCCARLYYYCPLGGAFCAGTGDDVISSIYTSHGRAKGY